MYLFVFFPPVHSFRIRKCEPECRAELIESARQGGSCSSTGGRPSARIHPVWALNDDRAQMPNHASILRAVQRPRVLDVVLAEAVVAV